MDPAGNSLTGCDQDIKLNASRPSYGKHLANAMNSSNLIYAKPNKRHFTLPQAEDCKGEIHIALPNDWLKISTLARLRYNTDQVLSELNMS